VRCGGVWVIIPSYGCYGFRSWVRAGLIITCVLVLVRGIASGGEGDGRCSYISIFRLAGVGLLRSLASWECLRTFGCSFSRLFLFWHCNVDVCMGKLGRWAAGQGHRWLTYCT
jgi:hypothetical protein